jgi:hypothetical protein
MEDYPEGLYEEFWLRIRLDKETGNYSIYCPEWRCELAGGQYPGDRARMLVNEIAVHNRIELSHESHQQGEKQDETDS